jgi:glucosamine-6-phosphate deaminase
MKVVIAQDRNELGRFVAKQAASFLREKLSTQDECNLVVATGSSQFEVLENLISEPNVDWSRVNGFHLDEYIGLDRSHPASFCGYLASRFVEKVPLKSFFYLDGTLELNALKTDAIKAISKHRIDLLLCGIGENGHLAFNDPPADFDTTEPYLIVELDEACRRQQVGEGWFDSLQQVPTKAISMSVHQILAAECILCAVPDSRKADAVRSTVEDEISPNTPATALRQHSQATLVLDSASASRLAAASLENCERASELG